MSTRDPRHSSSFVPPELWAQAHSQTSRAFRRPREAGLSHSWASSMDNAGLCCRERGLPCGPEPPSYRPLSWEEGTGKERTEGRGLPLKVPKLGRHGSRCVYNGGRESTRASFLCELPTSDPATPAAPGSFYPRRPHLGPHLWAGQLRRLGAGRGLRGGAECALAGTRRR